MSNVYTFGYQGRQLDDLVAALLDQGVRVLLDVRIRAASRKRGFAKTQLMARCESDGIRYIHDRRLGTPLEMLAHAQSGHGYDTETTDAYRNYLVDQQLDALLEAVRLASSEPTCLLCFERDPEDCHRSIVAAEMVARSSDLRIHHL